MKLTVAIIGAGRQGLSAAYDFAKLRSVGRVVLADRDAARLDAARARLEKLLDSRGDADGVGGETRVVDVGDARSLQNAMEGAMAVLSSVPYNYGPAVCAAAVTAGAHVADLGGNLEVSKRIHELGGAARARHVVVAPDCGLMPGLGNSIAGAAIQQLEAAGGRGIAVEIRCGGLPRAPRNALNYELVFSFDGLINEYDGESVVIRNGNITKDSTLEDCVEFMHPKLGRLESATTSGGTSTAPETWNGRVQSYIYKTVRYPGHFAFFRILKNLGMFGAEHREKLRALLEPALAVDAPDDLVLLRVDATAGNGESVSHEILDYKDPATGFTAMERMTAMPAVAVLELALEGRLDAGNIYIERDLPFDDYFARLARRGLIEKHL
ncbi:MAG: saccharopine dehydrogenase NADP-binding domain-containing protein [Planctomycetes bacterium]|nr:saccharopine dehydrogenase NADP-binding domain-containing protein [Planctomycetota bacterium]